MGWILAALAGGFLAFNATATPDRAASMARSALLKKFPGAAVEVEIQGKRGKDVLNGRFRRIDVQLANITLDELPFETSAPAVTTPAVAVPAVTVPAINMPAAKGATTLSNAAVSKPAKVKKPKLGRAGEINLAVRALKWNNLPVERADFSFKDVEYDLGALKNDSQFPLVRVGAAKMHLELAPAALTPFISQRAQNISNPRVRLDNERLTVNGERVFYGLTAPFELKGAPGFVGSQIVLQAPTLLVSGVTVPPIVAAPLLKTVNPLYSFSDLKGLPFDVKLTSVAVREGKLQVDADLMLKN